MSHAQRIRGHQPGSFFNRVTATLNGYVHDTLRVMAAEGCVRADADGEPVIAKLCDAEAFLGNAAIECEVDLKPLGLPTDVPLRAVYHAGKERIDWYMHSAYIASTPGSWGPEDAASELTPEKLRHAYQVFLGNAEPPRPPTGRGR